MIDIPLNKALVPVKNRKLDFISKEIIEKMDKMRRENLTEAEYKRLKLREDYDLPKRPKRTFRPSP
jgi:hypothetical protein